MVRIRAGESDEAILEDGKRDCVVQINLGIGVRDGLRVRKG